MGKDRLEIYGYDIGMPPIAFYRYINKITGKGLIWSIERKNELVANGTGFIIEVDYIKRTRVEKKLKELKIKFRRL